MRRFSRFVADGSGQGSLWKNLTRQILLGDEDFVTRLQAMISGSSQDVNIPSAQRHPPAPSLPAIAKAHDNLDAAIVAAYATGEYSYQQIAAYFGLHFTTVGKIVRYQRDRAKNHSEKATKLDRTP
jgi:hypothetical protein